MKSFVVRGRNTLQWVNALTIGSAARKAASRLAGYKVRQPVIMRDGFTEISGYRFEIARAKGVL